MAPYYQQICEELGWKIDTALLEKMQKGWEPCLDQHPHFFPDFFLFSFFFFPFQQTLSSSRSSLISWRMPRSMLERLRSARRFLPALSTSARLVTRQALGIFFNLPFPCSSFSFFFPSSLLLQTGTLETFEKVFAKSVGSGNKLDVILYQIRIGMFHSDIKLTVTNINKAKVYESPFL